MRCGKRRPGSYFGGDVVRFDTESANYRAAVCLAWRANEVDPERWGGLFNALTVALHAVEPNANVEALVNLDCLAKIEL